MKNQITLFIYVFLLAQTLGFTCQNEPTLVASNIPTQEDTVQIELPISKNNVLKFKGLSFVAPPRPFSKTPMMDVKAVNATWIAVIPYGYTKMGEPHVHYSASDNDQWWGETQKGVRITLDSAHQAGLNVMLKPQVYVPHGWTGSLDYATDADWEKWENDYEKYLMQFVNIAAEKHVAMVCVGTEFKIGVVKREKFWRSLIAKVRAVYKGKLTYAANWDEYPQIPFWDALDYAGINAYFPLVQKVTPSVSELLEAWKPHHEAITKFYTKVKKPILFTEFGYLSADGCAYNSWEVEKRIHETNINEQAQANAFDGLFATFWKEEWWGGGFLWKWFPEGMGHEGYPAKDYTPQGKTSEKVLKKWYGLK
jgi:hypothetical protein